MQNMLIFTINVKNGNRAGSIANMTVEDYLTRKKCIDRETGETHYVLTIKANKTYNEFGYAKLILSPAVNYSMDVFYRNFRPYPFVNKKDHGHFFGTSNGTSLVEGGKLSQTLSRHSKKAGLGHITSNTLRKTCTTLTREYDPTMAEKVANHMCHSKYTADRIYNLPDKNVAGVDTVTFIDKVLSGTIKKPRDVVLTDVGKFMYDKLTENVSRNSHNYYKINTTYVTL